GEGAAGRRSRSSTYPRAFCFVGLTRRAIAQALVLTLLIIKAEPGADADLGLGDTGIGVEVDLLVFEAAPQPLDEDVVHVAALAVPADGDRVALQGVGEIVAGELGRFNSSSRHDLCWPIWRHRRSTLRCLTVTFDEFISIAGYRR